PGTIDATVPVRFSDSGAGTTTLTYDADAVVGGMVGGVGQRMLTSVSKRMAAQFFGAVDDVLTSTSAPAEPQPATVPEGADHGPPPVYAPPPAQRAPQRDFWTGVGLGAGLVLLGAVAG